MSTVEAQIQAVARALLHGARIVEDPQIPPDPKWGPILWAVRPVAEVEAETGLTRGQIQERLRAIDATEASCGVEWAQGVEQTYCRLKSAKLELIGKALST